MLFAVFLSPTRTFHVHEGLLGILFSLLPHSMLAFVAFVFMIPTRTSYIEALGLVVSLLCPAPLLVLR